MVKIRGLNKNISEQDSDGAPLGLHFLIKGARVSQRRVNQHGRHLIFIIEVRTYGHWERFNFVLPVGLIGIERSRLNRY